MESGGWTMMKTILPENKELYYVKDKKKENNPFLYHLTKDQIIQDLPIYSKEPSRYQGRMTEEEIRGAQKKIGVCKK